MDKLSLQQISSQPALLGKSKKQFISSLGQGFNQHLQHAVKSTNGKLTVSKHAQLRMNQRNIDIDSTTWLKIESQVQQAKKMGVTESLVLTENAALIVSAKNNTVITALGRKEAASQIFTNINGTILVE